MKTTAWITFRLLRSRRPASSPQNSKPVQRRNRGIGAILAAVVAFLVKFKFLLIGAKLFAISWSFLLSLWIYVVIFGWKLAVVIMLLLLAHELGHASLSRIWLAGTPSGVRPTLGRIYRGGGSG